MRKQIELQLDWLQFFANTRERGRGRERKNEKKKSLIGYWYFTFLDCRIGWMVKLKMIDKESNNVKVAIVKLSDYSHSISTPWHFR